MSEQTLQRAVCQHLRERGARGLIWWHTPNGGRRSPIEAAIFSGLGVRPGVSDLILLREGQAFALELGDPPNSGRWGPWLRKQACHAQCLPNVSPTVSDYPR